MAAPLLASRLAPHFADRLGVESIEVSIGRPGLGSLKIDRFRLVGADYAVLGHDGQVGYALSGLMKGRVETIVFGSLTVAINSAPAGGSDPTPSLDQILPAVPFGSLHIEELTLEFPDTGFVGQGQAELGNGILAFSLQGVEPEPASHFTVTANLSREGIFEARLGQRDNAAEFLTMRGGIADNVLRTDGRFDVTGYVLELASAIVGLPAGSGTIRGQFESQLAWPLAESLTLEDVRASLPQLSIDWQAADSALAVKGLTGSALLAGGEITATVAGSVRATLDEYDINIALPDGYRLAYEKGSLRGTGNLDLRARDGAQDLNAAIRAFTLDTRDGAKLQIDAKIDARAQALRTDGTLSGQIALAGLQPTAGSGNFDFAGTINLPDQSHPLAITAQFGVTDTALTAQGELTSGVVKGAPFEGRYDLASGGGNFSATNTIDFQESLAAATVPNWQETYDLERGNIVAALQLHWRSLDKVETELVLDLKNANGHYDSYPVSGIGGQLKFSASDIADGDTWRLHPSPMRMELIDVGVPIRNLTLELGWAGDKAEIANASAALLGGEATAADFVYDLALGNADLTLALQNLDLAALLALEGDDIVGSGRLNGTLPVTVHNNKISISGGKVAAAPPGGAIRLQPSISGPSGQPGLDFALLALKNFTYSELDADIDYAENGDLQLAVHLRGRNPDVERGRPIHYNLNISENVPVLLESLRLQDQLTERIEAGAKK